MSRNSNIGLKGRTFWGRLWRRAASMIIGGAIGGPLGAILSYTLAEILKSTLPPHIEAALEKWADEVVEPITHKVIDALKDASPTRLVQQDMVDALNAALKDLTTLKAYYEFRNAAGAKGDEALLNYEKRDALISVKAVLLEAYAEATAGAASNFVLASTSFTPSAIKSIGVKNLNWGGSRVTASYPSYIKTGGLPPGGGSDLSTENPVIISTPVVEKPVVRPTPVVEQPIEKPQNGKPAITRTEKEDTGNDGTATTTATTTEEQPSQKSNNTRNIAIGVGLLSILYLIFKK